jgi:hypothetical protein
MKEPIEDPLRSLLEAGEDGFPLKVSWILLPENLPSATFSLEERNVRTDFGTSQISDSRR